MAVFECQDLAVMPQIPHAVRVHVTNRCGLNCSSCTVSQSRDCVDPTFGEVLGWVLKCYNLGMRCIEIAGGDPTLWLGIRELLKLCQDFGILTLLPVSGPGLVDSFARLGTDWLSYPGVVRISTHRDEMFKITLESVEQALAVATSLRPQGATQLGVVLTPGPKGNIKQEFLDRVLSMANERPDPVPVHAVTAWGTWQNGNLAKYEELWRNITEGQREIVRWFIRQPGVLPSGIQKVNDRLSLVSANNKKSSVCQAGVEVITIINGVVSGPCLRRAYVNPEVGHSLEQVLRSPLWLNGLRERGSFEECEGCTAGCHGAMAALSGLTDPMEVRRAFATM